MRIGNLGTQVCACIILGAAGLAAAATGTAGAAAGGDAVVTSTAFTVTAREVQELVSGGAAKHELFTKPLAKVRRELLDALIDDKLAALDAERRKLASEPDFLVRIDAAVDGWMSGRYIASVINPAAEPTDADLAPYLPKRIEKIRVRQLAVETEEEAGRLRARLAAGADFAALAAERSIAPATPANGGDMGWLTRGGSNIYPNDLLEVLFELKSGELSAVLSTPVGYEIFRIEERADLTPGEVDAFLAEPRVLARRAKFDRLVREACERQRMSVDAGGVDALAANRAADDTVLGVVGDWKLTARILRTFQAVLPEDRKLPTRNRAEFVRFVEMLLRQKSLRLEMEARGFLADPANRETIERFRKKTLAEYAVEKLLAPLTISEEDRRLFYRENRAKLSQIQRVRLKLITIGEEERAAQVHRSLQAGASWDELASAASVEANAAKGGDLGWLFLHQLNADYQNRVKSMTPGAFTAPFRQRGLWVILKVVEREEPRAPTEEEARGLLAKDVLQKKQKDLLDGYYTRLRKEYKVKINEAALEKISAQRDQPALPSGATPPGHPPTGPR